MPALQPGTFQFELKTRAAPVSAVRRDASIFDAVMPIRSTYPHMRSIAKTHVQAPRHPLTRSAVFSVI
jgi:hypothetical protein